MNDSERREASKAAWNRVSAGWAGNREYMWESSKRVGEWLVDKLEPARGHHVLEIAAGMGDTGFVAARLVGDDGRLLSTDLSPSMVEGSRRRAAELGIANAEFRVMDAEAMDLGSESFDGALCRWGLMLMADPGAVLRECHRVLKPGGRLCFSVFREREKNPWAAVPNDALVETGLMEPSPPGSPGPFALADTERVRELLHETGFAEPIVEEVSITWRHADFDRFWKFLTEVGVAVSSVLETLTPEQREIARESIREAVSPYRNGEEIVLPGVAMSVVTEKPKA